MVQFTRPKHFQTERIWRLARLPSFCEPVQDIVGSAHKVVKSWLCQILTEEIFCGEIIEIEEWQISSLWGLASCSKKVFNHNLWRNDSRSLLFFWQQEPSQNAEFWVKSVGKSTKPITFIVPFLQHFPICLIFKINLSSFIKRICLKSRMYLFNL